MNRPLSKLLAVVLGVSAGLPPARGAGDVELGKIEQEFEGRRLSAIRGPLAAYDEKLKALEDAATTRRDLAATAAVQKERERVAGLLKPKPASGLASITGAPTPAPAISDPGQQKNFEITPETGTVHLSLAKAQLAGGAKFDAGDGTLSGFTAPGAAFQITANGLKPGRYRCLLRYYCPSEKGGGGRFKLTINGVEIAGGVVPKLYASEAQEAFIGDVDVNGGPFVVKLETLSLSGTAPSGGKQRLMEVTDIALRPFKDGQPPLPKTKGG